MPRLISMGMSTSPDERITPDRITAKPNITTLHSTMWSSVSVITTTCGSVMNSRTTCSEKM